MSRLIQPGQGSLVAVGCGTAIASVCAIGLFRIERLLGGVWAVAAVLAAGVVCALLARAFGRLVEVVPSGAGLLAFLSRGLGRRAGLAVAGGYLLLTLALVGVEATIAGTLLARVVPAPPLLGAIGFLVGTWAVCRAGLRIGYRAQSIATWAMVACLAALSIASIAGAGLRGELAARLLVAPPSALDFVSAVGQALFLFMGFELVTSQVELAAAPRAIGRAMGTTVVVLAAFYALCSLGYSCLTTPVAHADALVPQLALAQGTHAPIALALVVVLSLLASFTSFHGALLALSRFLVALAAQGLLPRRLARIDGRTLVPREVLSVLLLLSIALTLLVGFGRATSPVILAAACGASLVYAAAAWIRERPPFAEPDRARPRRLAGSALAVVLFALGAAVIADAGEARAATVGLVVLAAGGALAVASRAPAAARPRTEKVAHAD